MRIFILLIAVTAMFVSCKKKESPKSDKPVKKFASAGTSSAQVASMAPEKAVAPAPVEPEMKAPEVKPEPVMAEPKPRVISSHASDTAPAMATPVMSATKPATPLPVKKSTTRVVKRTVMAEPVAEKKPSRSIVPGVDVMAPAVEPKSFTPKVPSTSTSGLYPPGAPPALRSFMRRRRAKVESCFKKALATGRMGSAAKYTVVVHCSASTGKLSIKNVSGDAARIGSFKRCVQRIGGTYDETSFARAWKFTMHLIP